MISDTDRPFLHCQTRRGDLKGDFELLCGELSLMDKKNPLEKAAPKPQLPGCSAA
jgi:hypothetical protein